MAVRTYLINTKLSPHFYSNEFKCPSCTEVKISSELIDKVEELFSYVNASKCIVSSGYRSREYDIEQNGFTGRHSEGLAIDCCFYDKNNQIIPSKIICCVAFELGFPGIAKINNNYVHLDIRQTGTYYGDETRGNSSYWTDPYKYFSVSKNEILKYKNETIKYQVYTNRWLPNVTLGNQDYAGIFGSNINRLYIDKLKYRVRVDGVWLKEVSGRNDFAGLSNNRSITDIAIEGASYRVHVKGGNWLGWVDGYNINDYFNGYAGNGKPIDAIEIR